MPFRWFAILPSNIIIVCDSGEEYSPCAITYLPLKVDNDYNILVCYTYFIIVGLCPFGGVILLSSNDYNLHGTFCHDGSYVLPLQKPIHQNNILIIQYSMNDNFEFEFVFNKPAQSAKLKLIGNKGLTYELFTDSLSLCKCEIFMIFFDLCECNFIYLNFRYYDQYPYIVYLESWSEYIIATIENTSGFCHSKQTNTSVVIEYKDGHNVSTNRCGGIVSDYTDNIIHIKIFLWITDIVSVYDLNKIKDWFFNVKQNTKIVESDEVMNGEAYSNTLVHYVIGYSGCFVLQVSNTLVDLRLDMLPDELYDIVITGSGMDTKDSPFGISIMMKTGSVQVELFYVTDKLSFIVNLRSQSIKSSLHVLRSAWFKLVYKYQPPNRKYLYHHSKYYSACNVQTVALLESIVCEKTIKHGFVPKPHTFVGSYDFNQGEYYNDNKQMDITESYIGPVTITATDATEACRQKGTTLLQTEIFGYWMDALQDGSGFSLLLYAFQYWHISFIGHDRLTKRDISMNCENIKRLFVLQYSRYSSYNLSVTPSHNMHILTDWLLRINGEMFCTGSNEIDIPPENCNVLVPVDYISTYSLLYVPCDLVLPHSGYVCEQRSIHKDATQRRQLQSLLLKQKHEWTYNEKSFMSRHGYQHLLDDKPMSDIHENYPFLFQCVDKTFLPDYYVCDGHNDCPGGGDEVNCS